MTTLISTHELLLHLTAVAESECKYNCNITEYAYDRVGLRALLSDASLTNTIPYTHHTYIHHHSTSFNNQTRSTADECMTATGEGTVWRMCVSSVVP